MYIIVEFEDLKDLVDRVEQTIDPDTPCDEHGASPITIQRVTEILDIILTQQQEMSEDVENLVCDDEIRDIATSIVNRVLARLNVNGAFQWMKVIDRFGGLVIRLKPGVLTCR